MTKVLGERVSHPITAEQLDVIKDIHPSVGRVEYATKELNALCPVTGQPDQYELKISYDPDGRTIESKSLKLYLWSFRDKGVYAENLAATIASDLTRALQVRVDVEITQQVRGGLVLKAQATAYVHGIGRERP